jgi:hypothetical protein
VGAGASELVNPEEEEEEKSVSQPVREGRGMGRRWSEVAHSALVSPVYLGFMSRDVHSCTHWSRPPQLPPLPPHLDSCYESAIGQQR